MGVSDVDGYARGPGGRRFLLLDTWKAVICDLDSSDGPARAEGAMNLLAVAVCRSIVERIVDAILLDWKVSQGQLGPEGE